MTQHCNRSREFSDFFEFAGELFKGLQAISEHEVVAHQLVCKNLRFRVLQEKLSPYVAPCWYLPHALNRGWGFTMANGGFVPSDHLFVKFCAVNCEVNLCSNNNCVKEVEEPPQKKHATGRRCNPCSYRNCLPDLLFALPTKGEILLHHLKVSGQSTVPPLRQNDHS